MEIIQLWTFWTFFWTFYLNHLSPLWGFFLFSEKRSNVEVTSDNVTFIMLAAKTGKGNLEYFLGGLSLHLNHLIA